MRALKVIVGRHWREVSTDYFAPESGQMPFLHLWSLGVEEQFYLLWPVALLLIYALWSRRAPAMAGGLAVAVVILSTVIAERQISKLDVRFAYYMLPARAGELAIGAALALTLPLMVRHFRAWRGFDQTVALTGWGLLLASLLYLSESNPFPGWRALPPTLGAAFLIVAGQTGSSGSLLKPLCHPASLWVGRSSYSAYLWHWPILAWWRYLWGQPTATEGALLLIGILLIGGGSQRWIEEPTRRTRVSLARTLSLYLGLPAVLIGIMALLIARGEHWGFRLYPPSQLHGWQTLKETNRPVHQLDWVCQQHILDSSTLTSQKCEFGQGNGPARVMLLGDSHAAQFAPVFRRAAEMQGVRVRSIALGGCAPLPGKLVGVVSDSRLTACEEGMPQVLARAQDFPLLIIGGAWATYSQNDPQVWGRLDAHLRNLVAHGHQVWLLPRIPAVQGYDAACLAKRLRVGEWLKCPTTLPQTAPNDDTNTRLAALARSIPGVKFLSLQPEAPDFDS